MRRARKQWEELERRLGFAGEAAICGAGRGSQTVQWYWSTTVQPGESQGIQFMVLEHEVQPGESQDRELSSRGQVMVVSSLSRRTPAFILSTASSRLRCRGPQSYWQFAKVTP